MVDDDIRRLYALRNFFLALVFLVAAFIAYAHQRRSEVYARPAFAAAGVGIRPVDQYPQVSLSNVLSSMKRRDMLRQSVIYQVPNVEKLNLLGAFRYLGAIEQGGRRRAFIQNTATNQSALYDTGANLADAQILEILPEKVVIGHGGERLELLR